MCSLLISMPTRVYFQILSNISFLLFISKRSKMAFDKEKLTTKILQFTVLFSCIHLFNRVKGKSCLQIPRNLYVLHCFSKTAATYSTFQTFIPLATVWLGQFSKTKMFFYQTFWSCSHGLLLKDLLIPLPSPLGRFQ